MRAQSRTLAYGNSLAQLIHLQAGVIVTRIGAIELLCCRAQRLGGEELDVDILLQAMVPDYACSSIGGQPILTVQNDHAVSPFDVDDLERVHELVQRDHTDLWIGCNSSVWPIGLESLAAPELAIAILELDWCRWWLLLQCNLDGTHLASGIVYHSFAVGHIVVETHDRAIVSYPEINLNPVDAACR